MRYDDMVNAHLVLVKILVAQGYSLDVALRIATNVLTKDQPLTKAKPSWPPRWLDWA